jgi:hypothetical protein
LPSASFDSAPATPVTIDAPPPPALLPRAAAAGALGAIPRL